MGGVRGLPCRPPASRSATITTGGVRRASASGAASLGERAEVVLVLRPVASAAASPPPGVSGGNGRLLRLRWIGLLSLLAGDAAATLSPRSPFSMVVCTLAQKARSSSRVMWSNWPRTWDSVSAAVVSSPASLEDGELCRLWSATASAGASDSWMAASSLLPLQPVLSDGPGGAQEKAPTATEGFASALDGRSAGRTVRSPVPREGVPPPADVAALGTAAEERRGRANGLSTSSG